MKEITITAQNWDAEVIKSEKPVLLDFWAPWCGPCKMLGPVIAEIAEEHDEIKVGKVNVDEESDLAEQFGVMSIPTLVMMKEGKVVNSFTGYAPKEASKNLLQSKFYSHPFKFIFVYTKLVHIHMPICKCNTFSFQLFLLHRWAAKSETP